MIEMTALRLSMRRPDGQVDLLLARWQESSTEAQKALGMWCVAAECGCWAVACHVGYCPRHSLNGEMRVMLLARDG